ncbi:hypothetical protein [Natrinema caseinilyticum]|uniref:hypothetical protein n=1 Tax=Natrinema caseinilyticum TaxID=2961570 RepID=UPI0020C48FE8|nr:hypothetical protein [Natrinema caseinilyticum]
MTDSSGWLASVCDDPDRRPTDHLQQTSTETHHQYLIEQQFEGARIAAGETVPCDDCGDCLYEGRPVSARACRYSDEPTYTIAAVYCAGCAPTDLTETAPGRDDVLLEADSGSRWPGRHTGRSSSSRRSWPPPEHHSLLSHRLPEWCSLHERPATGGNAGGNRRALETDSPPVTIAGAL